MVIGALEVADRERHKNGVHRAEADCRVFGGGGQAGEGGANVVAGEF
mgnify:CR=1 FL=1